MQTPVSSVAAVGSTAGAKIGEQMASAFRWQLQSSGAVSENCFIRLITGEPHPFGNLCLVTDGNDFEGAKSGINPLLTCSAPTSVIFTSDSCPSLQIHLIGNGYMGPTPIPMMSTDIASLTPTSLPDGCRFSRIGSPDDLSLWRDAFSVGYELPIGVAQAFTPTSIDSKADAATQLFGVWNQNRIVATSMLHLAGGLAGIYAVSTVPGERRKGLGAYVTAQALRAAESRGNKVGILQATREGQPVYSRLGFKTIGHAPMYLKFPSAD
jgi:hypothetical protein